MNTASHLAGTCVALLALSAVPASRASAQCPTPERASTLPHWRLTLDRVQVERARESGGDRPYFVSFAFRSEFGRAGSTVVLVEREPHDWVSKAEYRAGVVLRRGDHMSAGEGLPIPAWMGCFQWQRMPVVAVRSGLPTSDPTLFGVLIVGFDNNNTPPHVIRNIARTVQGNLLGLLRAEVETGRIAISPPSIGALRDSLLAGTVSFGNAFQLTVGSTFNPDKITGIQLLAITNTTARLPFADRDTVFEMIGGDRVRLIATFAHAEPSARRLRFEGSGATYFVDARLERFGGETFAWERINLKSGGGLSIAACANGRVYVLGRDGTLSSTEGARPGAAWVMHGRRFSATAITCAASTIYYLDPGRTLYAMAAPTTPMVLPAPRRLGQPFAAAALASTLGGDLPLHWVLNDDRTLWYNAVEGADGRWVRVGLPSTAVRVAAAPGRVLAQGADGTLTISETGRDDTWRRLGALRETVALAAYATGTGAPLVLYELKADGGVWRALER